MNDNCSATIFDIQAFSLHDGPGHRTTFFLKGCPLNCAWCCNPESILPKPQLFFRKSLCRGVSGCNSCAKVCSDEKISFSEKIPVLTFNTCNSCNEKPCVKCCAFEALSICGKHISFKDYVRIIERDRSFWGKDGGVTFSGGEPLFQHEFLVSALKFNTENYVHSVIETSAYAAEKDFLQAIKLADFVFIDIKTMNSRDHHKLTGVSNDLILSNIESLRQLDEALPRIVVRIPLIKNFNDSTENIRDTINFLKKTGLSEINILPYHSLGTSKRESCGLKNHQEAFSKPSNERIAEIQNQFLAAGFTCYTASNTSF